MAQFDASVLGAMVTIHGPFMEGGDQELLRYDEASINL